VTTQSAADGGPTAEVDVVVVEATVSTQPSQTARDHVPGPWRGVRLVLGLAEAAGDTVAMALERRQAPGAAGWNVVVGAGLVAGAGLAAAGRLAARAARPVVTVLLTPPLVPRQWQPARTIEALARLGGDERAAARRDLDSVVTALVPVVVERVLAKISLTELVKRHVDVDALVAAVDIDAIAARLDIDAVVSRVDLVSLADEVIEGIDLPEIIRESTGTVASEVVRGVRMQSIDADEAVARVMDRVFLRRRRRATAAPGESVSFGGTGDAGHDPATDASPGGPT
jgi:hypothetical protein